MKTGWKGLLSAAALCLAVLAHALPAGAGPSTEAKGDAARKAVRAASGSTMANGESWAGVAVSCGAAWKGLVGWLIALRGG